MATSDTRHRSWWATRYGALLTFFLSACAASIPAGKYGVTSLELEGVEAMDPDALEACLSTHERPQFGFSIGTDAEPECNKPPFDASRIPVDLWAWPWTDWPVFDEALLDRDIDRIERWYEARGYYDAVVTNTETTPDPEDQEIAIRITVAEGEPVLVHSITVIGMEALPERVQERVMRAMLLAPGDRFDEQTYDASKERIGRTLIEASYAKVTIQGRVDIDPGLKQARIEIQVTPGPACRFGRVVVEGNDHLPARPIAAAADIVAGAPYSGDKLRDAQNAVYALGAFASVEIVPAIQAASNDIDVTIRVVPGRLTRFGIGVGVASGTNGLQVQNADQNIDQWDLHLLLRAEHRNLLGGMRRVEIEDRPRLIFDDAFPKTTTPHPGNLLSLVFRQPAFLEPRTTLVAGALSDLGPDPYGGGFDRHDFDTWIGPERHFLGGKLVASSTLHFEQYVRLGDQPATLDYTAMYLQHVVAVDLRNDVRHPRRGVLFNLRFEHAGYFLPSDWNYLRFTPEVRGYVPLPMGMVLATRARFGVLAITQSDIQAPDGEPMTREDREAQDLRDLGPLRARLRGGGQNSVRGFRPNTLGDAEIVEGRLLSGGLRQWEASIELRVPLTVSFGTAFFVDVGDVTRGDTFRFNHPQTTFGFGLRYKTIVGPLRLDMGILPRALQVFGTDRRPAGRPSQSDGVFGLADGAVHLTIGEAY